MTRVKMYVTVGMLVAVAAGSALANGSPSMLLEKGIYEEETKGDVVGAMTIYQQIIDDADAGRVFAAKALYRLAMCHFKLGEDDRAGVALRRLIAEYPEQENLVAQAREHMPGPAFPRLAGCRLIETVSLRVGGGAGVAQSKAVSEVYACTALEIAWEAGSDVAGRVRRWTVGLAAAGADASDPTQRLWSIDGLPAQARVARLDDPPAGTTAKVPEDLEAGAYTVFVCGYGPGPGGAGDTLVAAATRHLVVKPLVMTQISVNDIQPDGRIQYRGIGQVINDSGRAWTTQGFISSDFVHLTGMSDANGDPVEFKAEHEGNIYRYKVTLNEPVGPGKPLLDSSEGTVDLITRPTDAKDEFYYYMRHSPNSGVPTRRIELYRLPVGAELLRTVPEDMARRTVDGRVELYNAKTIEAGGNIVTAFRYRLPGAPDEAADSLDLIPAPWGDGEQMNLTIEMMTGAEIGMIRYGARSVQIDGVDAWDVFSHMVIPMQNRLQYTSVVARKDTFAPITGRTTVTGEVMAGDYRAVYRPHSVKLSSKHGGASASKDIAIDPLVAYDNEQAIYLIRRMPLAADYRGKFPIFSVQGGVVIECRIAVVGRESVTVAAGTYDCYKVQLQIYAGEVRALQHTLWFSADAHRYLVQYDADGAMMKLVSAVAQGGPAGPVDLVLQDPVLTLRLPSGWQSYRHPTGSGSSWVVQLIPPEIECWGLVTTVAHDQQTTTARQVAEIDAESLKGFFKGYRVRPDSWSALTVGGLEAARYVADYEKDGKMVEYRTYVLGRSAVYWFVFRVEADAFDSLRPELDRIVSTMRTL